MAMHGKILEIFFTERGMFHTCFLLYPLRSIVLTAQHNLTDTRPTKYLQLYSARSQGLQDSEQTLLCAQPLQ